MRACRCGDLRDKPRRHDSDHEPEYVHDAIFYRRCASYVPASPDINIELIVD